MADLLFKGAPLTSPPVNLVFGGGDEAPPGEDRTLHIAGKMAPMRGHGFMGVPRYMDVAGKMAPMRGHGFMSVAKQLEISGRMSALRGSVSNAMIYQSRTSRPTVNDVRAKFQQALPTEGGVEAAWQAAVPLQAGTQVRWQDAVPLQLGVETRWGNGTHHRMPTASRYQAAQKLDGAPVRVRFQQGSPMHAPRTSRYQDGIPVHPLPTTIRFQQGLRDRRNFVRSRYQRALALSAGLESLFGEGTPLHQWKKSRYQPAIRPPAGMWVRPPGTGPDPCYIPPAGDEVDLLFSAGPGTPHLVFICETHGPGPNPGGETIVIPVREVYVIINNATLTRVDGNIPLVNFGLSFSVDVDSWTWQFSASLPASQLVNVQPGMEGDPVIVETTINGVAYRMLVESVTRERSFNEWGIRIAGRGINAILDTPYAPVMNFGNDEARTAQQLMGDVLTINGVPMDWTVDWGLEDWNVPGGIWTFQGSYMGALSQIVQAAGGYLQPDKVSQNLIVLPRYPVAPWNWLTDVTPDYEVPDAFATRDSVEWQDKAIYNRVYVSGTTGGVLRRVTRAGTDGGLVAQTVVDPLITDPIAGRQRGLAVLSDTGRQARVSLTMPVPTSTGLILPGKFVRYMEGATPRMGLVRGMNVNVGVSKDGALEILQTLNLETHLA